MWPGRNFLSPLFPKCKILGEHRRLAEEVKEGSGFLGTERKVAGRGRGREAGREACSPGAAGPPVPSSVLGERQDPREKWLSMTPRQPYRGAPDPTHLRSRGPRGMPLPVHTPGQ